MAQSYSPDQADKKTQDYVASAQNRLTEDIKPVKESATALATHLKEDAVKISQSAAKGAQKKLGDLQATAEGYRDDLGKNIASRPLQGLAVAFATGVFLTLILKGRSNS